MNQEVLGKCPICQHNKFSLYLICTDYLVSKEEFQIQECEKCRFRFTNPRPNVASLGAYYKSEAYISHNDHSKGIINSLYRVVRQYTLKRKLTLINSIKPQKGSLLDVGCGTGLFLETCKKGGWTVSGVELDPDARALAVNRVGVDIKPLIENTPAIEFDIITMWHVLEHVADLEHTVDQLKRRVKPGGFLLLALPNSDSADALHFKNYWAAYDVPRHLSHFTPDTIQQLIVKEGFTFQKKYPMYFDSFYVSMLSTQNRDGRVNWIESIYQGLRSNLIGYRKESYSSLIYLFRKL